MLLIAALAGCTSETAPTPVDSSAVKPAGKALSPPPTPTLRTGVEQACGVAGPAGIEIADVTVHTTTRVRLVAAVLGSGTHGVVLLHQNDDGLCGWLPYAGYLAGQGFQVAVFDRRCSFQSGCISGEAAYDFVGDVRAVVDTLRGRGAQHIGLVGASFGGAVAIGACAEVPVAACAALSPALFDHKLGDGVTAKNAISRIRQPLLVAVAPDDADSPEDDVRALLERVQPDVATFVTLPVGGGHGWDAVADPSTGQPTAFSVRLLTFLRTELT